MFLDQQLAFDISLDLSKNLKKKNKIRKIIFICSIIFISILIVFLIFFFNRNKNYHQIVQFEKEESKENKIEEFEELIQLKKTEQEEYELEKSKKLKLLSQSEDPLAIFYESIPASLTYNNDGYFDLDWSGFESILKDNKKYKKENSMIIYTTLSNQMAQLNENMDISNLLDITVYHCDINFKTEIKKFIEKIYESEYYSFIAKIKLGSISISFDDIKLKEKFINDINIIANNEKTTNDEKAKYLDELINIHGYYIPLKINFGGLFMIESEYIKNSENEKYITIINETLGINKEIDINTNYSNEIKNIFNEFYSNSKKTIIGGDYTKDNFDDWLLSINENNADIINYDNIIKITDLLDLDLKIKLKEPLKIIDEKYEKRKNYYETLNNLKQSKKRGNIIRKDNDNNDIYELGYFSDHNNLIYNKTIEIYKKYKNFKYVSVKQDISTNDIIVGIKIISKKDDNGKWEIKENPLVTNQMTINFKSEWWCGLNYKLILYLMKLPS